jgi:hypothetical protein
MLLPALFRLNNTGTSGALQVITLFLYILPFQLAAKDDAKSPIAAHRPIIWMLERLTTARKLLSS